MKKLIIISGTMMLGGLISIFLLAKIPFGLLFKLSGIIFFSGGLLFFLLLSIHLLKSNKIWKKIVVIPVFFMFLLIGFLSVILARNNAKGYTFLANSFLNIIPADSKGAFTTFPYSLTKEEWKKDIQYLKEELPKHHANPFLYMGRNDFYNSISALEAKLDRLSDGEIAFEICRIISLIKDGHTQMISVAFNMPPFLESRLFPLRIFFYKDGLYVTDGGRDYKELEGLRITRIGETTIEEVIKRIYPFVPGENDYYKMYWSFPYLLNAELLKYTGIIEKSSEAEFTFMDESGKEFKKSLSPVLSPLYLRWFRETLSLDDMSGKNNLKKNYWFEYNPTSKAVFFQLNQVNSQQGEPSLKDFTQQMSDFVDKNDVTKFIIDMRNCSGGDNTRMVSLLNFFSSNKKINQYGKLFTLIGRQTFSAGVSFIAALERNTNTIFVGEPSGSGPNQCGDVQTFALPNSKLILQVSSRFHQQSFYSDHRLQITPSVAINYTYKEWKENKDPAIIAINSFKLIAVAEKIIIDSAKYALFTGRYSFDADKILTIKPESGNLVYEIKDYKLFAKNNLLPVNETSFTANNALINFQFTDKKDNKFQKIIIKWANVSDTLQRLSNDYLSPSEFLQQGNIEKAVSLYRQQKEKGFVFSASTELEINSFGYAYAGKDSLDIALLLFALNTELFPSSGNTWDSLAETWLKKGDKEKAKLFYTKCIEMNPENNGAKDALKSL